MSRSLWLGVLLVIAILSIVAVVGLTRPVRVEPSPPGSAPEPTAAAPAPGDAGTLDSLLDGIRLEHAIKHGR